MWALSRCAFAVFSVNFLSFFRGKKSTKKERKKTLLYKHNACTQLRYYRGRGKVIRPEAGERDRKRGTKYASVELTKKEGKENKERGKKRERERKKERKKEERKKERKKEEEERST